MTDPVQSNALKLVVLLLALVTASALAVVYSTFKNRQLFIELQQLEGQERHMQIELGKLLLEESAWSSPAVVEQLARRELSMQEPGAKDIVLAGPSRSRLLAGNSGNRH